ncbi:MAG TPA: hypothetical protein VGL27_15265 [Negativicutes bacterium]
MLKRCKIQSVAKLPLLLLSALFITIPLAYHNIADPNFWFDESGQFWMAKGLNHFSPPLSSDGSLYQVMLSNRQYNLDPGGFTLLLHYWLQGGADPVWLRALPCIFLVLTFYFLMRIAAELSGSALVAVLAATVSVLPFDMVLGYGFELRPYSMEVAGIVASFFFLLRTIDNPNRASLLALGLVCSFFLTSRYSFIIAVVSIGIVLLAFTFQWSWRKFITGGYGFYIPVICMSIAIWFISLSQQDPNGVAPFYVNGFILQAKSLPQIIDLVQINLFSLISSPYLIFIAVILLLEILGKDVMDRPKQNCFRAACLFLICFQIISIVLSAMGKYPWHINTRWNINLQALVIIASTMLIVLIADCMRSRWDNRWWKIAVVVCVFALAAWGTNKKVHYSYDATYSQLLSLGNSKLINSEFFVGYYASPSVRYLFEYGPLKNRKDIYPRKFYFESRQDFFQQSDIEANRFDVALLALVDQAGVSKYQQRFNKQFVLVSGQPLSYLLLKSP